MTSKSTATRELEEARALKAGGRREEAAERYFAALESEPGLAEAARELALLWNELGDADQAEYFTRRFLELEPRSAPMHLHLGNLLRAQGRLEEALAACAEAAALEPGFAQAHNNLGNAYRDLGRTEEASECFRRALAADPRLAEAHLNYGILLHHSGERRRAIEHYREAMRSRPDLAQAALNLGFAYEQEGEAAQALASYARTVELAPELPEAHVNYALQCLLHGDFARGWQEYEWRWRLPQWQPHEPLAHLPRWDGAPLEGRTILLFGEQGFGDVLQFARYASLVAERGGRVALRCQAKLAPLLASVPGVTAAAASEDELPRCDVACPLLSLPRIFATVASTIPKRVPYVRPDPARMERWRAQLGAEEARLKIALHWATESGMAGSAGKSLALSALAPLASDEVVFYSLQRGGAAEQARQPPPGMRIRMPALADFADDAALMANVDLVISIDTASAHLAGALGVPVWTLIRFPPEWRWQLDGERTPWYPTMRLFRQGRDGGWETVVEAMAAALAGQLVRPEG